MSKNDGGPVFARPRSADPEEFRDQETYHAQEGISLRAYLVSKAPISLYESMIATGMGTSLGFALQRQMLGDGDLFKAHADMCCKWADAIIAALEAS